VLGIASCTIITKYVRIVHMDKKPIYIKRKIDTKMRELLKLREIVAVVGPRQSGKTTYLQHLMQDVGGSYMTFEDRDVLQMFDTDIKAFVATYLAEVDILCIDEFQYARGGGKQLIYKKNGDRHD
jgi:uncharacterized protein